MPSGDPLVELRGVTKDYRGLRPLRVQHLLLHPGESIALVAIAGFAVLSGHLWARIFAIIIALGSAITNFFYIPYYPFWSILMIAIDVVIIWGLSTYGRGDAPETNPA